MLFLWGGFSIFCWVWWGGWGGWWFWAFLSGWVEEVGAGVFVVLRRGIFYVFQNEGPDGVRPTELAQRALMTKQAMNHLLSGLEQIGYIERVTTAGDGRARVVQLTAKGRRLTEFIQQSSARIERRWEHELGAARTADVRAALEDLDAMGVPT